MDNRLDDRRIAGATTQIPGDGLSDLIVTGVGRFLQQGVGGHEKAGYTKATLQGMVVLKGLLQRMQGVALCQPLDGHQLSPVCLHGEHETGTDRSPVIQDSAGPADPMFTPEMRASQVQVFTQEISQRQAHGDGAFVHRAIDAEAYATRCLHSVCPQERYWPPLTWIVWPVM